MLCLFLVYEYGSYFQCDYPRCKWAFFTHFRLKRHRETHLKKKDFTVSSIEKPSWGSEEARKRVNDLAEFPCLFLIFFQCPNPNCDRSFTTIYNLKTHQKLHQRPAVIECPVPECSNRFQTKRHLEVHMREHGSDHAPFA